MKKIQVDFCVKEQSVPGNKNRPRGAGALSRDFTINLSLHCRAFSRTLQSEKLKASLFPGPIGAGTTKDWCIRRKCAYRILPNYCTCSYKHTIKQLVVFRLQPVYFYLLLYKNICCWYSFELPRQVEAIQMNTNNIYCCKECQKNIAYVSSNKPLMKFSADLSLNCTRIRRVYYKFF